MARRLEGKVAIITGAGCVGPGWGNGRAASVIFAQEGAKIFAVDLFGDTMTETLEKVRAFNGEITPYIGDVTKHDQVASMIKACLDIYGKIDILVNNVGGSAPGGAVALPEETWNTQLDRNLKSVYLVCKHVIPVMEEHNRGVIVNISSTSGLRWTGAPQIAYAASKAAIIQFSRVTAVEYAKKKIRVNTVIPGQMHTPMVEARLAGQRTGGDVEALLEARLRRIPLGFMGDGRDTAYAALFLASDEARFITGTEIIVDGGMVARCD